MAGAWGSGASFGGGPTPVRHRIKKPRKAARQKKRKETYSTSEELTAASTLAQSRIGLAPYVDPIDLFKLYNEMGKKIPVTFDKTLQSRRQHNSSQQQQSHEQEPLDEYYTLIWDSPLSTATIILRPAHGLTWLEQQWTTPVQVAPAGRGNDWLEGILRAMVSGCSSERIR